jgi:hypothetical protein
MANQQEIDEECENIKTTITESAKEIVQLQEKSPNNEWCDEKCRQAIKQKNITKMKCLRQKTRANEEHYKRKKKQIKYINKKRNYGLTTK